MIQADSFMISQLLRRFTSTTFEDFYTFDYNSLLWFQRKLLYASHPSAEFRFAAWQCDPVLRGMALSVSAPSRRSLIWTLFWLDLGQLTTLLKNDKNARSATSTTSSSTTTTTYGLTTIWTTEMEKYETNFIKEWYGHIVGSWSLW